jgi:hypothetical protein
VGNLEDELLLLRDFIGHRRTGIVIDIGANFGIWSYPLSKIYTRVEAFEPFLYSTEELKCYGAKNITYS